MFCLSTFFSFLLKKDTDLFRYHLKFLKVLSIPSLNSRFSTHRIWNQWLGCSTRKYSSEEHHQIQGKTNMMISLFGELQIYKCPVSFFFSIYLLQRDKYKSKTKKAKIIRHQNQFWVPRIKIKAENNVLIQKGNEKKDTEKK